MIKILISRRKKQHLLSQHLGFYAALASGWYSPMAGDKYEASLSVCCVCRGGRLNRWWMRSTVLKIFKATLFFVVVMEQVGKYKSHFTSGSSQEGFCQSRAVRVINFKLRLNAATPLPRRVRTYSKNYLDE